MAEMIPESMPSGKPRGERLVFDVLQKLPDDWFVYYEPVVSERCPDFLLICPDLGVLVIEVKGWPVSSIVEASDECIKIRDGQNIVSQNNPVRQARNYMFRVMDTCRTHPEFKELCHAEGKYEGNYLFPFGHVVFLSKITATELEVSGLSRVFRDTRIVTRDVLDSWSNVSDKQIKTEIQACFALTWPFPRLTARQVDILRSAIHPDIIVGPKAPETKSVGTEPKPSAELTSIKILDWQQEVYARKIGDGHRVLNGVAGSGKTILLIHRARWLSEHDPGKKILVLCYNRALSAFLKSELHDCQNVRATTFHQWAYSHKAKSDKDLQQFGLNVLARLEKLQAKEKYDAILIDEAQDFERSWFQCAVEALKDGDDGDLIIVADGNQGIFYRPKEFKWIHVGVKARGRVIPLRRNYRNTDEIMDLAWVFAEQTEEDNGEAIISVKPFDAVRHGPEPYIYKATDRQDENKRIVILVKDLLDGKWRSTLLDKPLAPSEIGVIYPRIPKSKFMWKMFFLLKEALEQECDLIWLNDFKDKKGKDRVTEPGLKIQTIDSSKGLQYRAAILMWADLLPSNLPDSDKDQDRRKLYVALTRAQDFLAVTYSEDSELTKKLESSWSRTFQLDGD
jgi:hypothetical protein